MKRFEISREPCYEGADSLSGESWASWGPRGLSCGHPTRQAAEQAQVREYATDPDRFDRLLAMDRAKREARAAARQAERPTSA